jgi:hypothetical protein
LKAAEPGGGVCEDPEKRPFSAPLGGFSDHHLKENPKIRKSATSPLPTSSDSGSSLGHKAEANR